ncbi:MAG: hypothetical protein K6A96_10990 [Prevotella sp.]|nr:hypothetical protein [Prevotella sp.]
MKKIMFNDRYGLTDAVLKRQKTMTRRIIKGDFENIKAYHANGDWHFIADTKDGDSIELKPAYEIGEQVAIAQNYKRAGWQPTVLQYQEKRKNGKVVWRGDMEFQKTAGWTNKMFVLPDLMPHRLVITGIAVERLQDISDADCRREGIIPITWRQYHRQALDDLSPQRYTDHHVYTLEKFREGISDPWADSDPDEYLAETPQIAFAVLISKMMSRKVWEQNPYVFVYTFALLK